MGNVIYCEKAVLRSGMGGHGIAGTGTSNMQFYYYSMQFRYGGAPCVCEIVTVTVFDTVCVFHVIGNTFGYT